MHRTEGANNVGNLYTNGPPGTTVTADSMNALQEEICNVIESAGLTLLTASTDTRTQLLAALQALFIEPDEGIGKNAIINSDFRISQRGASGSAAYTAATTPANNDDTYLHDRWVLLSDGNDIVDVSQDTEVPDGFLLSCALDIETINKKFGILQVIEQKNCQHMIGDTVSLSFYAKVSDITKLDNIKAVVLSWDGVADTVTSDVVSAWNAEDATPTWAANWTAENTPSNLGVTASWVRYEIPNIAIDTANTTNIAVFIWSDGFCDTVAKFLYITGVQLEKNIVASEYEWNNIFSELAKCQRYYCKSYAQAVAPGTVSSLNIVGYELTAVANADHSMKVSVIFPVIMRSIPSITLYSYATGTSGKIRMAAGDVDGTAESIQDRNFVATGTNGAVNTSRSILVHYTADIEL